MNNRGVDGNSVCAFVLFRVISVMHASVKKYLFIVFAFSDVKSGGSCSDAQAITRNPCRVYVDNTVS